VGLRAHACAIGQAAAALFAQAAPGRDARQIRDADDAIAAWLAGGGFLPDWPGFAAIAAARDYPARHGAIRLAWQAARELLPTD
jgi:NifU-like protein involved in Fe-S cluster formation